MNTALNLRVTIVMYHYVRELARSRYPRIKGLELALFRAQLEYFQRHYNVIGPHQMLAAIRERCALPPRALLLTFDDGYLDHYTNVFPLLFDRRLSACFFPVADSVTESKVLDVNKIQHIIAASDQPHMLVEQLNADIRANRGALQLDDPESYWQRCAGDSRYDGEEVTYIKRMLQRELPEAYRHQLVAKLFARYVSADEASFAAELYANHQQLRCMVAAGMCVGSHGASHYWMNRLSAAEQVWEIDRSLEFLATLGVDRQGWVMCYPYGAYDERLRTLIRQRGCAAALAVTVGVADLERDDPLALPRLDTNDLPKQPGAAPDKWAENG